MDGGRKSRKSLKFRELTDDEKEAMLADSPPRRKSPKKKQGRRKTAKQLLPCERAPERRTGFAVDNCPDPDFEPDNMHRNIDPRMWKMYPWPEFHRTCVANKEPGDIPARIPGKLEFWSARGVYKYKGDNFRDSDLLNDDEIEKIKVQLRGVEGTMYQKLELARDMVCRWLRVSEIKKIFGTDVIIATVKLSDEEAGRIEADLKKTRGESLKRATMESGLLYVWFDNSSKSLITYCNKPTKRGDLETCKENYNTLQTELGIEPHDGDIKVLTKDEKPLGAKDVEPKEGFTRYFKREGFVVDAKIEVGQAIFTAEAQKYRVNVIIIVTYLTSLEEFVKTVTFNYMFPSNMNDALNVQKILDSIEIELDDDADKITVRATDGYPKAVNFSI
jgi:hypothetical protein